MNGRFLKKDLARAFQHMGFLIATSLLVIIFVHAICANVNFDEEVSTYEIISAAMALSGGVTFAIPFAVVCLIGYLYLLLFTEICDEIYEMEGGKITKISNYD